MSPSLLLLLLAAAPSDPVVARVGKETILASEVAARARRAGVDPKVALDDLVAEVVLADAARREGLKPSKEDAERLAKERRAVATLRLLERESAKKVVVTDAQVTEALHATQDRVRVSMVIRATPEEAKAALDRIRAGASFEEEAKASIDDFTRSKGGSLGWMALDAMAPDLARAVSSAKVGEPTGPAPLQGGYAVILVRERQVADDISLAPLRGEMRQKLEAEGHRVVAGQYVASLRKSAGAKIDVAFLASTGDSLEAKPKEKDRVVGTAGKIQVRYGEVLASIGGVHLPHPGGKAPPQMKEQVAWVLLDQSLLAKAAADAGLTKDAATNAAVKRAERAVLASAYAARLRAGVPPPTDAEVEARYQQRASAMQVPAGRPCWRLASATQEGARKLRARVVAGEPLEQVAKDSADKATAARGGSMGLVPDGDVERLRASEPALARCLSSASPGDLTEPVQTRAGWEVVRCGDRQPARQRTLAEVRHALSMEVQAEQQLQAVRRKADELRQKTQVVVEEEALRKVGADLGGRPAFPAPKQ